jgi:ADP-ribosyl-[dinitrogen reductase] hydrolase
MHLLWTQAGITTPVVSVVEKIFSYQLTKDGTLDVRTQPLLRRGLKVDMRSLSCQLTEDDTKPLFKKDLFSYQLTENRTLDVSTQPLSKINLTEQHNWQPSMKVRRFYAKTIEERKTVDMWYTTPNDTHRGRRVACFLGMVVGDALGAPLEFEHVVYESKVLTGMNTNLANKGLIYKHTTESRGRFKLKPGQWTDDASMGLCLADSLLVHSKLDPLDLMLRFLAWWHTGYNNAFEKDPTRKSRNSIGLGGNIGASLRRFQQYGEPETKSGNTQTSGNGSLMRLAAIPVYYAYDKKKALEMARVSSLVTHQGHEARDCCALMTHVILTGFSSGTKDTVFSSESMAKFVHEFPENDWLHTADALALNTKIDEDRNWDWKNKDFMYSRTRANAQPGYVGSYAMDALSMALHCVYTTTSFSDATLKAANLRGDADTVCAITGQIAGSIYGLGGKFGIPLHWLSFVRNWDTNDSLMQRALLLSAH